MTSQALILTDNEKLGDSLTDILDSCGFTATVSSEIEVVLNNLPTNKSALVLVDLDLSSGHPIDFLARASKMLSSSIFIPIASQESMVRAREAADLGFCQYIKQPLHPDEIHLALEHAQAVRHIRDELDDVQASTTKRFGSAELYGSSPEIQSVLKVLGQAASTDANVMVIGEPGTGKRLIAEVLHQESFRKSHRFLCLSCAGLSDTLIESELFGNESGVYSGADVSQLGRIALCDGGTLFVDEIGELSRKVQDRLLRFVTNRSFEIIGHRGAIVKADVRIVSSSSQNIEQFVRDGRFNKELFQRLNGVQIKVPPLRQRKSDIPALVDQFVREIARGARQSPPKITPEALVALMQYDWPGNVRELQATISHAMPLAEKGSIAVSDLPSFPQAVESEGIPPLIPGATIYEIEREAILRTLEFVGGSTTRAARTLNMSVRKIQYKLKEYRTAAGATVRSETNRVVSPKRSEFQKPVVIVETKNRTF